MTGPMLRFGALAALLLVALETGASTGGASPGPAWAVQMPAPDKVRFKGVPMMDEAGKPGTPILYPAAGAAGLVAAIITHGVILNAVREGEKSDSEKAADKVLEPYQPSLDAFTQRELLQAAAPLCAHGAPHWLAASDKADAPVVASQPVFSMTQDRAALILDNDIRIQLPGNKAAYANKVRVVSAVQAHEDLAAWWGEGDARALKEQSARLLAASIDIALEAAKAAPVEAGAALAQRTVRYREGGKEVFERAEILREDCDRLLLRNLRGWLMSVPRLRPPADCPAPPQ
ncbi:hypothetical protein [Massilia niabensis]|uniref:Uncharacterized protein n=1 Tax=Massilia niabensis TaxID=544910 RepID=A0ABW0L742_9BURK